MIVRPFLSLLGLSALLVAISCTPKPTPGPERVRPGDPRTFKPVDRPAPPLPAPEGPDISDQLLASLRVGALDQLDRRLAALMPAMVPAEIKKGLFTRRLLPELARDLGLNALALEALDFTRPSAFGLLLDKPTVAKPIPVPRVVGLLPLRGDARLVVDALRESWPESRQEPWGGVHIQREGQSVAWVHAREGFVVVAPTAPLLHSALRALAPQARDVDEGAIKLAVRFAALVDVLREPVSQIWGMLKGRMDAAPEGELRSTERMFKQLLPEALKLVPYIISIARLELSARIADHGWSFHLKATPRPGGKMAAWLGRQRPPDGALLDLLPPEASLVSVARHGERARVFGAKLFGHTVDWVLGLVASNALPEEVRGRGLLDRPRPVPLEAYRRELRDLNLEDYRASHALYRFLFGLKALRSHMESSAPRLVKVGTGETAMAFYASGGRLGQAQVEGLRSAGAHRAAMVSWATGIVRIGNQLMDALWDAVPAEARKALGATLGLRRNPLRITYSPVALRVGQVSVSSLSLEFRLPPPPKAGPGVDLDGESAHLGERVQTSLKIVEHLFGKGGVTYSWAYKGDRLLSAWGHGWQGRMTALVQGKGAVASSAMADPLFNNATREVTGESLSLTLASGSRLLLAVLSGVQALFPQLVSGMGPAQMLIGQLRQDATAAQSATLLREVKEEGSYRFELNMPNDDIKTALMGAGMFLYFALATSSRSVPHSKPAQPPVHRAPGHPSHTSPPDSSTQP